MEGGVLLGNGTSGIIGSGSISALPGGVDDEREWFEGTGDPMTMGTLDSGSSVVGIVIDSSMIVVRA